jgi:hypothetical integral membrane protein (TIGR02206 family)
MDTFRAFSLTHAAVVLCFAAITAGLVAARRRRSGAAARHFDFALAWLTLAVFLFTNGRPLMPRSFRLDWSLPLHVCDLVTLFVPLALRFDWRPMRALVYFWGIGLCTQGFLTPDLQDGPAKLGFWSFWLAHFSIVGAAIYDVAARGYRPAWGDYRTALIASFTYVGVILPLDVVLHVNYGYVGPGTPGQPSLVDVLGPWPWRVPIIVALAVAVMALLMLPWCVARPPAFARGASADARGRAT